MSDAAGQCLILSGHAIGKGPSPCFSGGCSPACAGRRRCLLDHDARALLSGREGPKGRPWRPRMTLRRQVQFWLLSLIAFVLFMMVFSAVLLPFVAGMALAYLLDPVADRLERMGMNRLAATLTILLAFVIILAVVLILLVPVLGNQMLGFIDRLPALVRSLQSLITENLGDRLTKISGLSVTDLQSSLGAIMSRGASWLGGLLTSVWSGGQALLSILSLFVITPVVAFYLLLDWDHMIERIDSWLPREHVETVRQLAREMDGAVAGFVRGQVSVCFLLGMFYAVSLVMLGLNFGLLIGIGAGLVSFIPFVGAALGLIASMSVAIVQFWPDWPWILAVALVFGVGQFIEGNILQPKLVGASVGLHPVWLMFSLFAFGYLFGFVGLLVAVPAAAMVGVLARFALTQYLASPLYRGAGGGHNGPSAAAQPEE
ncbi:AI-2E family transporter [Microvirga tunisiensis]|uniref:AI-2E family transporter n=2 Tax=Pannonibacter tanglangensis TaxID=2750084 RepID=A0ABW9ZCP0_9HYPH|nr:AI-2E family transporter [Pannonibacter sp. XCT-34]NBN62266.1 AI-2E family transporter [Pannonibacter sp. XCT-34]